MRRNHKAKALAAVITVALLSGALAALGSSTALADPAKLAWSIVETPAPGQPNNIIVSPSEINTFVVGADGNTLYSLDIPNNRIFKSLDGGSTWPVQQELGSHLIEAGAYLPVWNIAIAPDDPGFVVAITDGNGGPNGPKEVFVSRNGGASWDRVMSGLVISPSEFISSVDVSADYGGNRDIAIGTRTGTGNGKVWVARTGMVSPAWTDQGMTGDVVAMKFSPTYVTDPSLAVVYSNGSGTYLNIGIRDTSANTTDWVSVYSGSPREVTTAGPNTSPEANEIITADLELPSDFSGQDFSLRRLYVSTDAVAGPQTGVYRIDNLVVVGITPPITILDAGAPRPNGVSSIAYYGTYAEGVLLAGEVATNPTRGMVNIRRTSNPADSTPTWQISDEHKSPTGGGTSWFANAQVAWSFDGTRAYCGTSSANLQTGGTAWALTQWPRALLNSVARDESAFSVSPYSHTYEQDIVLAGKNLETTVGIIWNQTGLIDTEITFLSDVAALDVPEDSTDYPVRYLASINSNGPPAQNFDSIWRRTGDDDLPQTWERILCIATASDASILRINPRKIGDQRSQSLVFAGSLSPDVRYSPDEGQTWQRLNPGVAVTDLSLASDTAMYILSNTYVRRGERTGLNWIWASEKDTLLSSGHTIATPLENPEKKTVKGEYEDWVAVGSEDGYVACADFSEVNIEFIPPPAQRTPVPIAGKIHVIFDEKFHENGIIYAASNDTTAGTSGKIYRWKVGQNTAWDELAPPNNAFYGVCQAKGTLYGVWNTATPPETPPGVDRTLYPRSAIPPPIEWDDLTAGLPAPPNTVLFTREPSALKISTNDYNNLWAIDDRPYNYTTKTGCLWAYTDTMSKKGPWATAPPSGDLIPVDPVSGRADEVNFAWDSLEAATGYELQIAKDKDFKIRILSSDNITPVDQTAPAVYFPAGGLSPTPASAIGNWGSLEAGHDYYWRVRANRAATGEIIRSPWSATMYFTVKIGVPTTAEHLGLKLLKPSNGCRDVSLSPSFSWAPFPKTTAYEFMLARDPALSDYIVKTTVSGTAYEYKEDALKPGTVYYWQVRAIKPVPGDPSPVATFTTIAADEVPQTGIPKKIRLPFWIWAVIGVYAVLITVLIVFASTKPAYFGPPVKRAGQPRPLIEKSTNPFTRIVEFVSRGIKRRRYLDEAQSGEAMEPEPDAQPRQAIKPRRIVEKPDSSFSEKIRAPFDRIAEAVSPRIRRRHYLDELEERGIIKPEPIPAEEMPGASLLSQLKSTILSRFRKKQHPEDEEHFQ